MTQVNGKNSSAIVLVKETPQGIKTGLARAVTKKGSILVETSPRHLEVWDKKDSKTVQQLVAEKNRKIRDDQVKINVLANFASVQNKIIEKLSGKSGQKVSNKEGLDYKA